MRRRATSFSRKKLSHKIHLKFRPRSDLTRLLPKIVPPTLVFSERNLWGKTFHLFYSPLLSSSSLRTSEFLLFLSIIFWYARSGSMQKEHLNSVHKWDFIIQKIFHKKSLNPFQTAGPTRKIVYLSLVKI